jgi:C4-dicarboxylate-specific signal transduction histidine kinase
LLEGLTPTQPAGLETLQAFKQRLDERSSEKFEVFIDFLELGRFPGSAHEARTARYLSEKFIQNPPAILVPISRGALSFLMKYRPEIGVSSIPIVYCCTAASAATAMNLPGDVRGVVTEYNWSKTLELAQGLQPAARNLVMISGASDYDRAWQADAKRELAPYLQHFNTRYLAALPYREMLDQVSRLTPDTIVLLVPVFVDGSGIPRVPPDVADDVTKASPAPVYAPVPTLFDHGIVGGYMDSFEAQGMAAADLVLDLLRGKPASALPAQAKPAHRYRVDARQLERFQLPSSNLPPDAIVSFRQPSLWEQHRNLILATVLVFAIQSIFVAALLIQRRRRRVAEEMLKESEERMTFTAASVNVGLWQFEPKTQELWTTEHCRALFGLGPNVPLAWDTLLAAVHPEDREISIHWMRKVAEIGKSSAIDFRVVLANDQVRWLRTRARAYREDSTDSSLTGVFVDVTDQKLAEIDAAEQRHELTHLMRVSTLGGLSGAIAHEINQPLTAILSNAHAALHLLAESSPDLVEVRGALEDIVHEDNRASDVIQRLRSLMRKGDRKSERIDVNALVRSTISLLNSELISRRMNLDLALAGDLPAVVGDPVQLQQVLLNLLMNAMDATASAPGIQRRITLSTCIAPMSVIQIIIRDYGTGISPDRQSQLFKSFYTSKEHGLGLGLAICQTIVQAHGGSLVLANHEAGGAIAVVSLPIQEALMAAK